MWSSKVIIISGSCWRLLLTTVLLLCCILLLFNSLSLTTTTFDYSFPSSSFDHIKSLLTNDAVFQHQYPDEGQAKKKEELERSRIAVCLVGGARRFELTGPSIVENVLKTFPNADLFLHSPLDRNSFKFSLLKAAPRIASVRIFKPVHIDDIPERVRALSTVGSPNGIQGLLQYFNLVEGCLSLITAYQDQKNITYDWIVRGRVDGYWNAPINPNHFIPGHYVVPSGTSYYGLNDRFGIGDLNSSIVALSRLSLITMLHDAGFRELNSEGAFKAQLTAHGISFSQKRIPFCIVTERTWTSEPINRPPVAKMSSLGPLSGCYCKPCKLVCRGACVADYMSKLNKIKSWTDWENKEENFELCDASSPWEKGWEKIFDRAAGTEFAASRRRVSKLTLEECVEDIDKMKEGIYGSWDAPSAEEVCKLGLGLH